MEDFVMDDNLKIELLKNKILDELVESQLPIMVINLLFKDILSEVSRQASEYTNQKMKEYEKYLEDKKKAEELAQTQPEPEPPMDMTPPSMETVEEADIVDVPAEEPEPIAEEDAIEEVVEEELPREERPDN